MLPRNTEFKALEEKSTRLSRTHSERHSIVHCPVWDTEPRVWECGENAVGESTTTLSHIPPTKLFSCKNSLDLRIYSFPWTTFLGSPQNKCLTASLDGVFIPKQHSIPLPKPSGAQYSSPLWSPNPSSGRNRFPSALAHVLNSFGWDGTLQCADWRPLPSKDGLGCTNCHGEFWYKWI